ncbi:hypothetical protein AB4Y36_20410 [Paraburkholderia sp. BR10936]|uniref:hypothetical protein n=1 Tax=Paraburkholderia sp. BR10936 TaxID=3236993 RepID=UPI0034D2B46E
MAFVAFSAFGFFAALTASAAGLVVADFVVFVVFAGFVDGAADAAFEVAFCDAVLRRSARAEPEDFTMFSLRLARIWAG